MNEPEQEKKTILLVGAVCTRCGKNPQMDDKTICASCWLTTLLILGRAVNGETNETTTRD